MLKRLIIFGLIAFIGFVAGLFLISTLLPKMGIPAGTADFVMIIYAGLFIIAALVFGKEMVKDADESEAILPAGKKGSGKSYAWLNHAFDKNRAGFPITKKLMTIGRDPQVDILINDPSISKKHAEIIASREGFLLKDLDSTNGTFINNQRVQEKYLTDGDTVTFGDSKFTFAYSPDKAAIEIEIDIDSATNETGVNSASGINTSTGSRLKENPEQQSRTGKSGLSDGDTYSPDDKSGTDNSLS